MPDHTNVTPVILPVQCQNQNSRCMENTTDITGGQRELQLVYSALHCFLHRVKDMEKSTLLHDQTSRNGLHRASLISHVTLYCSEHTVVKHGKEMLPVLCFFFSSLFSCATSFTPWTQSGSWWRAIFSSIAMDE